MKKIIDMYKYCVQEDKPLMPPFEADPENPAWYDFFANTYFADDNYYEAYGQKDNGGATTGIIGGDNSEMLSQNNMFNGYTKQQALMMGGDTTNPARDDNSYFSADLNGTPTKINFSAKKNSS